MLKKRRRDLPAVDVQLVEIYEDLANVDEAIRLKAAHTLLTIFVSERKASGDQLNEILRRLIRGLCSGRKAARLGFSIALTEALTELLGPERQHVPGVQDIPELIETLQKQTRITGGLSGQEERDHEFGRLFGTDSIIKSGILFAPNTGIGPWAKILDIIYELAKKKSWLREECGFIVFDSLRSLRDHDLKYAQLIIDKLHLNGLSKTTEGVAIWIATHAEFPALEFPKNIWHREDPLDREESLRLAKILKETSAADPAKNGADSNTSQKGNWTSKLHFAWDVILLKLLDDRPVGLQEKAKPSHRVSFADFWEECVDNNLFSASSSEERKYWGFLLFQRMIHDAPANCMPVLFSKNVMRCITNQLSTPGRYLHRAADKTMKAILARAQSNLNVRSPILKALLAGPNGNINFDKVTKTKTVETILSLDNGSAFEDLIAIYNDLILRPDVQDEKLADSRRQAAADQLVAAVRSIPINPTKDASRQSPDILPIQRILALLTEYAYFDVGSKAVGKDRRPLPPITKHAREIFRSRITSSLAYLVSKPMLNPSLFAYGLVWYIHGREQDQNSRKTVLEADDRVHEVIEQAWQKLNKTHQKERVAPTDSTERDFLNSLKLLYSLTILQVFNEDPEAVSILEELNGCYRVLLGKKGYENGFAALVEILLGLVAKKSLLMRRLVQLVFTFCASYIDQTGLQSMIKILDTEENIAGQAEMFDQDGENDDASEQSDVEEIDINEAGNANSSAEDGSDDDGVEYPSGSASDNESDGPDEELAAFDAKLAQALGTRPGNEDLDADDSSSSDQDMNDEQMEAVDEHLEKVFRERAKVTSKKTEKEDAKEVIVNFKCRVLELLEIYVKQQHADVLALDLLLPILTVIRTTTSPLVSSRACTMMREYSRLCKGESLPQFEDTEAIFNLLAAVHVEAMKEGPNAHASACSQASLLLVRVLVAHDRECLRRVVRIYGNTQEESLFDTSCKVKTSLFTDWLNWCASARK